MGVYKEGKRIGEIDACNILGGTKQGFTQPPYSVVTFAYNPCFDCSYVNFPAHTTAITLPCGGFRYVSGFFADFPVKHCR